MLWARSELKKGQESFCLHFLAHKKKVVDVIATMLVQIYVLCQGNLLAFPMWPPWGSQTTGPLSLRWLFASNFTLAAGVAVISQVGLKAYWKLNSALRQKCVNLRGDDISVYCSTNLGRRGQQLALTLRVHVGVSHVSLIGMRRYFDGIVQNFEGGCSIIRKWQWHTRRRRRGITILRAVVGGTAASSNGYLQRNQGLPEIKRSKFMESKGTNFVISKRSCSNCSCMLN